MTRINEELGRPMTAREIAAYLDIDVKTARKYYQELGGVRIGSRYKFFEMEVCDAVQKIRSEGRQDKNRIYRTSEKKREEGGKTVQDEERGAGMGNEDEKSIKRRLAKKDQHGLFG
jgi:hypothetical protein